MFARYLQSNSKNNNKSCYKIKWIFKVKHSCPDRAVHADSIMSIGISWTKQSHCMVFHRGCDYIHKRCTGSSKAIIPASTKIIKLHPLTKELLAIDGCWRRRNRFLQGFCLGKSASTHIGNTQY